MLKKKKNKNKNWTPRWFSGRFLRQNLEWGFAGSMTFFHLVGSYFKLFFKKLPPPPDSNSLAFLEKGKHRSTIWLNSSTPKHILQMKTGKMNTYTALFSEALFIIAEMWKHPKYPSTDECINRVWYIHRMNGILLSHEKWTSGICDNMDKHWKPTILCIYSSQTQKGKYCMIPLR